MFQFPYNAHIISVGFPKGPISQVMFLVFALMMKTPSFDDEAIRLLNKSANDLR